jgi:hypothetical protein
VQKIDVEKLTRHLKDQKAVLSPVGITKKFASNAVRIDLKKLTGIVVDDEQADKTGDWVHSVSSGPFVGEGYLHDNNEGQGKRKVRFLPNIDKAGSYEVRLFYAPNPNRATNALIVIKSADGEKSMRVNQKLAHNGSGVRLGTFNFDAGKAGFVEIRNDGANGHVIADAVQWLPATPKQ